MDWLSPQTWLMLVGGGFTVGLLVGMTGVGAGSLMTPFLISAVGVNPLVAVGTDLLFAGITKASAAVRHHRLGNVDTQILGWLAAGSLPGAAAVFVWLSVAGLDQAVLAGHIKRLLAIILVVSATAIAVYPLAVHWLREPAVSPALPPSPSPPLVHRPLATLLLGAILGITVALTSVGAGAIGVVVLTALYPALMLRRLVGTDIVHAIPLTLLAGLGHLSLGHIDWMLLGALLAGSLPGIAVGSRLTGSLPDWALRATLAAVLCLAAYTLVRK
jgi:uncharacterized protein